MSQIPPAGDIGSVPVVLLEGCLHACSARQLARIEDETRCVYVSVNSPAFDLPLQISCAWHYDIQQLVCKASLAHRANLMGDFPWTAACTRVDPLSQGDAYRPCQDLGGDMQRKVSRRLTGLTSVVSRRLSAIMDACAGRADWTSRWRWRAIGSAAMSSALAGTTAARKGCLSWKTPGSPCLQRVGSQTQEFCGLSTSVWRGLQGWSSFCSFSWDAALLGGLSHAVRRARHAGSACSGSVASSVLHERL